jgi:hypothetical protein
VTVSELIPDLARAAFDECNAFALEAIDEPLPLEAAQNN